MHNEERDPHELGDRERAALAALAQRWSPTATDPVAFALELEARRRIRRLRRLAASATVAAAAATLLAVGVSLREPRVAPNRPPAPERAESPVVHAPLTTTVVEAPIIDLQRRDPWLERAVGDPTDPRRLPGEYGALAGLYLEAE